VEMGRGREGEKEWEVFPGSFDLTPAVGALEYISGWPSGLRKLGKCLMT